MFRDSIIAAIRTGVAVIVTFLVTKLLGFGVELDPEVALSLNVALFGLFVAAYNFLVGFLERKVNPYFGVLLGIPKAPAYGTVGTQTPPPHDPLVGNPPVDRGATSLALVGGVIAIVGLLLLALTVYDTVAMILLIVGVVVGIYGVATEQRY